MVSTSGAGMGFGVKFQDMQKCQQSIESVKQTAVSAPWDDGSKTKYFAAVCKKPEIIVVEEDNDEKK